MNHLAGGCALSKDQHDLCPAHRWPIWPANPETPASMSSWHVAAGAERNRVRQGTALTSCVAAQTLRHGRSHSTVTPQPTSPSFAQVERDKRRAAAAAAKEKAERQAKTWTGWLLGSGKPQQPAPEDTDMRADLNEEEQAYLQNMVNEQEAAMQGALQIHVHLRVYKSTELQLQLGVAAVRQAASGCRCPA